MDDSFFALTPAYLSISLFFFLVERNVYIAGITNKVNTRENIIPPTITIPNGIRLVDDAPNDNANGNAPKDIAKLVIKIGRKRCVAAKITASVLLIPFSWL